MKEMFLRLAYLLRNKDQDYRIGQLMLCVILNLILRMTTFKYQIFVALSFNF
jgi:hypothetical protein